MTRRRRLLPAATVLAGLTLTLASPAGADDGAGASRTVDSAPAGETATPEPAAEAPPPPDPRSTPSPALVLSAQVSAGGAATSFDGAGIVSVGALVAARLGRLELGVEAGLFAAFAGFDERTGDPPRLVSLGGEVGYRAHPGERLTVPLRIRGGALLPLGDTGVPDSAPDGEPWYVGGRVALGFEVDPSLELEITLLDVQGLFWRNDVSDLDAALAIQAGLRVAWATGI